MRINIDSLTPIKVARHYDGAADVIEFDVGRWIEAYPALTEYRIEVTSPGGAVYFPETVNLDGRMLKWTIMPSDTGTTGDGEYQIVATGLNDERKTSASARFVVREIMEGTAGETPPDPAQPWVDKVLDAAERAEAAAERAENAGGSGGGSGGGITKETDPTVPEWAKQPNPPTYTAQDVGARPADWLPTPDEIGAQPAGDYALKSEILAAPVQSVNGKTGAVELKAEDVGAASKESVDRLNEEIVYQGKAAVKSVNGVKPDENGNVQVQGGGSEGEYELIDVITLKEDMPLITLSQGSDGTPYKFKALKVMIETTNAGSGATSIYFQNIAHGTNVARLTMGTAAANSYTYVHAYEIDGAWNNVGKMFTTDIHAVADRFTSYSAAALDKDNAPYIDMVRIYTLPANSKIIIKGVRA